MLFITSTKCDHIYILSQKFTSSIAVVLKASANEDRERQRKLRLDEDRKK